MLENKPFSSCIRDFTMIVFKIPYTWNCSQKVHKIDDHEQQEKLGR